MCVQVLLAQQDVVEYTSQGAYHAVSIGNVLVHVLAVSTEPIDIHTIPFECESSMNFSLADMYPTAANGKFEHVHWAKPKSNCGNGNCGGIGLVSALNWHSACLFSRIIPGALVNISSLTFSPFIHRSRQLLCPGCISLSFPRPAASSAISDYAPACAFSLSLWLFL